MKMNEYVCFAFFNICFYFFLSESHFGLEKRRKIRVQIVVGDVLWCLCYLFCQSLCDTVNYKLSVCVVF